ncbi:MAG: YbaK/EbsC family protein [Thermoanaerobaculia bacterium]
MPPDPSIVHPRVADAVRAHGIVAEVLACRSDLADTAEFCAHYGFTAEETCNTILVVVKKTPREFVACLIRSDTRLDVNRRVAAEVGFKRLSFAGSEETAELSGMEIGGVALVGLPHDMPILIDRLVMEKPLIIVGGGNRTSKLRLDPRELLKLPGARVAEIATPRGETS